MGESRRGSLRGGINRDKTRRIKTDFVKKRFVFVTFEPACIRTPGGKRDFYVLQKVQPISEAHPATYSVGTGLFPWLKRPGLHVGHSLPTCS